VSQGTQRPAQDHAGVLIWPPVLCAVTVGLGGALHLLVPVRLLPTLPSRIAGAALICLAAGFALWAERVMHAVGTNVRPDRPTTAIVSTGPYRVSRNPMYVSLCALQVGIALLIDGLMPLLFLLPLAFTLHFGVIRREERYLEAKFGADYVAFRSRVRRWL
jgi:protein-S-isoprenylcysteine O-methyltransferase Ste14